MVIITFRIRKLVVQNLKGNRIEKMERDWAEPWDFCGQKIQK